MTLLDNKKTDSSSSLMAQESLSSLSNMIPLPPAPSTTTSTEEEQLQKEESSSYNHTVLTLEFNNLDDNDCGFLDMFSFTISELTSGGEFVVVSPAYSHFPPGISSKSFELPPDGGGSWCYVVQNKFNAAYTCDSSLEANAHFGGSKQYSTTKYHLFVGNGCPSEVVAAVQQQEEHEDKEQKEGNNTADTTTSGSTSSTSSTRKNAPGTATSDAAPPPKEQQERRGTTPEAPEGFVMLTLV